MPYYHVHIKTRVLGDLYELDNTDLSKIKEEIIIPYLRGDEFYFCECSLDKDDIITPIIKKSYITYNEYTSLTKNLASLVAAHASLKDDTYFRDITRDILKECKSQIQKDTSKPEATTPNITQAPMDKSKVFIVHGHDGEAKQAVARFVEKIGFEAIILHEQASSGNTIIEKIEANSNVGFGIVLYTPCDLGASQKQKDQLKPRARQNVVFEHGYLIGKIGRKNVCAVVKGDIETPNDISGVVYIKMDEGRGWMYTVAKEMQACGYEVDLNKI
nr:nucleotide-binding protein [uncultured Porphyromonas sp.]